MILPQKACPVLLSNEFSNLLEKDKIPKEKRDNHPHLVN
jgi:hypothetical protein